MLFLVILTDGAYLLKEYPFFTYWGESICLFVALIVVEVSRPNDAELTLFRFTTA